jgi:hypothetical protein
MTSANTSFPTRLTKIDPLTRLDHNHLIDSDECYFLGEYTARRGFSHSTTNNLIINFKKPMDRQGTPQWPHKGARIMQAAQALHSAIREGDLNRMTFVPVPPSKSKTDPMYDDRMMRMLLILSNLIVTTNGYPLDVKEIVSQNQSCSAAHDGGPRPSPADLISRYSLDRSMLTSVRPIVVICDDVLTTGSHFRAMHNILHPHCSGARFMGLFLARRAPEAADFSLFFDN